jgi:1,4-dihydroxy-2-naphthoyl-CoA hydrolase
MNLDDLSHAGAELLPGHLGIDVFDGESGLARARLEVGRRHLAPNGFLHAAAVVALADTACGYGCMLSLPEGALGFTTIELKTNFLRSTQEGTIECEARLAHGGRTTQVWDAAVTAPDGRAMALFRCTQLLLRG